MLLADAAASVVILPVWAATAIVSVVFGLLAALVTRYVSQTDARLASLEVAAEAERRERRAKDDELIAGLNALRVEVAKSARGRTQG